MLTTLQSNHDTLFYDAKCPRCAARAASLLRHSDHRLQLRDIHSERPVPGNRSKLLKLRTLHLLTAEGYWLTGLDAALRAHSHSPWGWFYAALGWPGLKQITAWVYSIVELRRYRLYYGCSGCAPEAEDY
jgi:predicted DCC family thiol-disulfide oxidoreductase YuxK